MKKINIPRIIWVSSIFIILSIILVMVVDYKINYQYFGEKKLYFYNCNDKLCVSETKVNNDMLYSSFSCGIEECPKFQKEIEDNYVILTYADMSILFDYKNNKIITQGYDDYEFINSNYIIVTKDKNKGIINLKDEVTANIIYDDIGYKNGDYLSGYNINSIIAKRSDKYGIISIKDGTIIEEFKYGEDKIDYLLDIIKKDSEINT